MTGVLPSLRSRWCCVAALLLVLMSWSSGVGFALSEKTCAHAQSLMLNGGILSTGDANSTSNVFSELLPVSDESICKLESTCCTEEGEGKLRSMAAAANRDTVGRLISGPLLQCYNHSFIGATQSFIAYSKTGLVSTMLRAFSYLFEPYQHIFDDFFLYLQKAVVTGNTCRLPEEFNKVFFELYLAAYISSPSSDARTTPNSPEYRQCFYQYFLKANGNTVSHHYQSFVRSFNRLMYFIRALRTVDRVVESILRHPMTRGCSDALLRMTHCSQCAGFSLLDSPICPGYCLNTMRGCLAEFSSLVDPMRNFTASLLRMKQELETNYNPWDRINQLDVYFLTMATHTGGQVLSIQTGLATECGSATSQPSPAGKRSVPRVAPRGTQMPPPSAEFNHSAYCLSELAGFVEQLPNLMCDGEGVASENLQCWNGHGVETYSHNVLPFTYQSQQANPEVAMCSRRHPIFHKEIAMLNHVARELDILSRYTQCSPDDEDCTVEELCDFQPPSISLTEGEKVVEEEGGMSAEGPGSADGAEVVEDDESCLELPTPSSTVVVTPATHSLPGIVNEGPTPTNRPFLPGAAESGAVSRISFVASATLLLLLSLLICYVSR